MRLESRVGVGWPLLVGAGFALLAVGAGSTFLALRWTGVSDEPAVAPAHVAGAGASAPGPSKTPLGPATASGPLPDVRVTLTTEAVDRAGITVVTVTAGTQSGQLRAPGVVEPNAYKVVAVTPLVSGRVSRVAADLGDHVRRGQTLAQIFSPELAEAQTRYISIEAELAAHERELVRTGKLVEIGAASAQELERIHAEHTARRADLQTAASRLQLLGLSSEAIDRLGPGAPVGATIDVPAPMAGVVTERRANVGLNVDPATSLFTVVDLSSVWVVAALYEKDFGRVAVGSGATVTTTAYPDLVLRGTVSYIDPQLNTATRTAKMRIEVPNAGNRLRFGMYAEATLAGVPGAAAPMVPRSAVQHVADRTVVYVVDPHTAGVFTEREVRLGAATGDLVSVLGGVNAGDVVVAEGSFHVRAERERLGLRQVPSPPVPAPPIPDVVGDRTPGLSRPGDTQTARIVVGDQGYSPATLTLRAGSPVRLTFVRTSATTCGTEVAFPSLTLKRSLPLNEPVVVEFTPAKAGLIAFTCGLEMLKGALVVE